jgi:hypothetical protein
MTLDPSQIAPCTNAGIPPSTVIDRVSDVVANRLQKDADFLARNGLTPEEYLAAFPFAIERIRGRMSATNSPKRAFVSAILDAGVKKGLFSSVESVVHDKTQMHAITLPTGQKIGLLCKGCPDGNHTTIWSRPPWATELFLWWLCPQSPVRNPGTGIWKGIGRLKRKFCSSANEQLDGVIFYDNTCGTTKRPCPKASLGLTLDGISYPPPCIYVLPPIDYTTTGQHNWRGEAVTTFAPPFLQLFGVPKAEINNFTSFIGFRIKTGAIRATRISNHYGCGCITTFTTDTE